MLRVYDAKPDDLKLTDEHFGNKSLMKHQAQGFEHYSLIKSYSRVESTFLKTVKTVPHSELQSDAITVNSQVMYKVKKNDDSSVKLKTRIAANGSEDYLKHFLISDCTTCPPIDLKNC